MYMLLWPTHCTVAVGMCTAQAPALLPLCPSHRHGMVMLQKLSETRAAASPLQAQIHRVAKRVEALMMKTYDVLSSSVKEEVSQSLKKAAESV